ncbi:MAG: Uma2 family endonuclease [Methylobacteriaceae bacterium]|nr:Uma2 family endonuclease [Methylobacteriaceae bacterium]
MGVPVHLLQSMTVEDFLGFTESRPDEERWELIDGEPILNASPSYLHQKIVGNLIITLSAVERRKRATWSAIPGIGVRLSERSAPVPDVLVRPKDHLTGRTCDDMIVAFEVLSPKTSDRDLHWKRQAYASLPSLAHYVVIAQDTVEVAAYARHRDFSEQRLDSLEARLDLDALGASIELSEIYRDTGLQAG